MKEGADSGVLFRARRVREVEIGVRNASGQRRGGQRSDRLRLLIKLSRTAGGPAHRDDLLVAGQAERAGAGLTVVG